MGKECETTENLLPTGDSALTQKLMEVVLTSDPREHTSFPFRSPPGLHFATTPTRPTACARLAL
jgi:hypothetical protein